MNSISGIGNSKVTSGKNKSYWVDSVQPVSYEKLTNDIQTDVLVIGGGISGLTTAYCMLRTGLNVVLIEDGFIGSGESGRTTAHLSYALDDGFAEIEKAFGKAKSRLAAESHIAAIQYIENIVREENIDCHFRKVPGYLFLGANDKLKTLKEEFEATKNAGLQTSWLDSVPGIVTIDNNNCIKFPDQAQFHPMRYMRGLAEAILRRGGSIYTETKAEDISSEGAKANGFQIKARHIVVATNTPVNDLVTMHTKQYPYRTYVIAAKIGKGKLPYSLWWDTGNQKSRWASIPYHYIRLEEYDDEYDLLISGGEDHRVGQASREKIPEQDRYFNLYRWTKIRFPSMGKVEYHWSGQVMEPVDMMAFIGKNPGDENIYIITGDSGHGMTHGTIGGMLITDMVTGKDNPWVDLYDPSRMAAKSTMPFIKESVNMAAQYTDWLTKGDFKTAVELKPGHGGIISSGLNKIAVYRDEENKLHAFSAVCPHLKGILHWNDDEKSFDCPVHGSRFAADGKVINGPAISDLKEIEIREDVSAGRDK